MRGGVARRSGGVRGRLKPPNRAPAVCAQLARAALPRTTCPANAEGILAGPFLPRGDMRTMPAPAGKRHLVVWYLRAAGRQLPAWAGAPAARLPGFAYEVAPRILADGILRRSLHFVQTGTLEGMTRTSAATGRDREAASGAATAVFVLAVVPVGCSAGVNQRAPSPFRACARAAEWPPGAPGIRAWSQPRRAAGPTATTSPRLPGGEPTTRPGCGSTRRA